MMLDVSVRLYRNPWSASVDRGAVLGFLMTAATNGAMSLERMIGEGEIPDENNSFGAVFLDPTRPSGADPRDLLMAAILIGENGGKFLPNALAKACAHSRLGMCNGVAVREANYCLADGDFAWGDSAELTDDEGHILAIGGGSGLSVAEDRELTLFMMRSFFPSVHNARAAWVDRRRRIADSHGWYNRGNQPGFDFVDALSGVYFAPNPGA